MENVIEQVSPWWIALAFATGMFAAWAIGWKWQRQLTPDVAPDPGIRFIDAGMALLGLLLGFTFSMSLGRHEQRRATVVSDSNSIGDFYACASLLKEPYRSQLQAAIADYARHRLAVARGPSAEENLQRALSEVGEMHSRMTQVVAAAVADGTPIAVSLAGTLNGVTSSNASRLAAYRDRLPWSIVLLLFVASIIPAFLMGQQQGVSQRPHLSGTIGFILLVTLVTYVTLDLNQPSGGLIRVSQEPIERLVKSVAK